METWYKFRHKLAISCIKPFLKHSLKKKYNFKAKTVVLPKGPTVILCNHQTTDDPLMVIATLNKLSYSVIAKDFIKLENRKKLEKWYRPVWKAKTLKELGPIKNIFKIIKEGQNIIIFPEGNRTFSGKECYIGNSTANLIKKCACNLVILNIQGGFAVEPRYSKDFRKGQVTLVERKRILKEDLVKLSVDEIHKIILENLDVDEVPAKFDVISNERAMYLERILFRCPCCKTNQTIKSDGNDVLCTNCNMKVTYGKRLTFENPSNESFKYKTVDEWYFDQYDYIRSYKLVDDEIIFKDDNAILEEIDLTFEKKLNEGTLTLTNNHLTINNQVFNIDDIIDCTASGKQTFLFYIGNTTYRIKSDKEGFNALKYVNMFYHIVHVKHNQSEEFLGI